MKKPTPTKAQITYVRQREKFFTSDAIAALVAGNLPESIRLTREAEACSAWLRVYA